MELSKSNSRYPLFFVLLIFILIIRFEQTCISIETSLFDKVLFLTPDVRLIYVEAFTLFEYNFLKWSYLESEWYSKQIKTKTTMKRKTQVRFHFKYVLDFHFIIGVLAFKSISLGSQTHICLMSLRIKTKTGIKIGNNRQKLNSSSTTNLVQQSTDSDLNKQSLGVIKK